MTAFALYLVACIVAYLVLDHHMTKSQSRNVATPHTALKGLTMLEIIAEPKPGVDQIAVSFEVPGGEVDPMFGWLVSEELELYECALLGFILSPVNTRPAIKKTDVREVLNVIIEIEHDTIATVRGIIEGIIDEIEGIGKDSHLRLIGTERRRGSVA
jgi:hypothetical protein